MTLATDPDRLNLAAVQAMDARQDGRAETLLRQALAIAPGLLQVLGNLGNITARRRAWVLSVASYRRAMAIDAKNPVVHLMLGSAQLQSGDPSGGIRTLKRAIELRPGYAAAHANLGNAYVTALDLPNAAAHYRKAIELDPGLPSARVGLCRALREQWRLGEATTQARLAVVLAPGEPPGFHELSGAERANGKLSASLTAARRALACNPGDVAAISNYLFGLHFDPASSAADIAHAHRVFGRRIPPTRIAAATPHRMVTDSEPLRVGFVSADFRRTPASWFLTSVLAGRDPASWRAICYADVAKPDEVTERLKGHADLWRPILGWTDARLAAAIGDDRIDVLFDLSGHTAGSRLSVFAGRAAPIQATWLGYNDTTGVPEMDFILADPIVVPDGDDPLYTETVIRLRDGFVCYTPPDYAPTVAPPPAATRGFLTYGCYGQLTKISDGVLDLWARLFAETSDTRLIIMAPGLGHAQVQETLRARLSGRGIPMSRIEMKAHVEHRQFFESYADVDLMLDTSPYGAGTTACEALWMGVPIVTLPSDRLLGRQSASHLRNIGLPEFIADDPADYVRRAAAWSSDRGRLARIRAELRERMRRSPLVDQTRFAGSFVQALDRMRSHHNSARSDAPFRKDQT